MDINALFPSNYLKASDLGGQPRRVIIEGCAAEAISDKDTKPVLRFVNVPKGLILNRTNATVLASGLGNETTAWIGATIELFSVPVPFQGRMVDAIRCRVVSGAAAPAPVGPFAAAQTFQQPAAQPQAAAPVAQPAANESPPPSTPEPAAGAAADPDIDSDVVW